MHLRRATKNTDQERLPLGAEWDCPAPKEGADFNDVVTDAIVFGQTFLPLRIPVIVEWTDYPVTAGRAFLGENRICLSRKLLTTAERVWETVLHEYAHLVVWEFHGKNVAAHGTEWKNAMRALGLEPRVTHNYECERRRREKPFAYKCKNCSFILWRTRPFKRGRSYTHVGCGGRFVAERKQR